MVLKLVLLVGFVHVAVGGFLEGDCVLKYSNGNDVEYGEWLYDLFLHPAVPDTAAPGTEVTRFSTRNIEKITNRLSKYIKLELTDGHLILTINEDFTHFEEWETQPDFKVHLDFQCNEGTARIAMWGLVEDSNDHAPSFGGAPPYAFALPLPFPPGIPLSCVTGVVVSAVDVDLSTTHLHFQIIGSELLQVATAWKVGRAFHANVTATRYITAPLTATLRVTDNGEPTQSTETTLSVLAAKTSLPQHSNTSLLAASDL